MGKHAIILGGTHLYWRTNSVTDERTTGPCMGHSAAATVPNPFSLRPMPCDMSGKQHLSRSFAGDHSC